MKEWLGRLGQLDGKMTRGHLSVWFQPEMSYTRTIYRLRNIWNKAYNICCRWSHQWCQRWCNYIRYIWCDCNSLPYSAFLKEISFRGLGSTTHFGAHAIAVISRWMKRQQGDVCFSASSFLNQTSVHASPCLATHKHCAATTSPFRFKTKNMKYVIPAFKDNKINRNFNCSKVIGRIMTGVHIPSQIIYKVFVLLQWFERFQTLTIESFVAWWHKIHIQIHESEVAQTFQCLVQCLACSRIAHAFCGDATAPVDVSPCLHCCSSSTSPTLGRSVLACFRSISLWISYKAAPSQYSSTHACSICNSALLDDFSKPIITSN